MAYGYWVQQFRRLMGVTILREFARLRIRRVPFIGVPREFVRDRARGRRVVQEVPAHGRMRSARGRFLWASGSDVPEVRSGGGVE